MSKPYKPDGYSAVSPYLIVNGAEGTIAFLQAVFGAKELRRFEDDSGQLNHAEVRLYDTVLMIADRKEGWPSNPAHIHIYVPDVDASYQTGLGLWCDIDSGTGEKTRSGSSLRCAGCRWNHVVDCNKRGITHSLWMSGSDP